MKKLKSAQLFFGTLSIIATAMEKHPSLIAAFLVCAAVCFAAAEIVRAIEAISVNAKIGSVHVTSRSNDWPVTTTICENHYKGDAA